MQHLPASREMLLATVALSANRDSKSPHSFHDLTKQAHVRPAQAAGAMHVTCMHVCQCIYVYVYIGRCQLDHATHTAVIDNATT
jgi:hypothetical protein